MATYIKKNRWTLRQIEFLESNYGRLTDEQIAQALGRSYRSVQQKRQRLGLDKEHGRGRCIPKK